MVGLIVLGIGKHTRTHICKVGDGSGADVSTSTYPPFRNARSTCQPQTQRLPGAPLLSCGHFVANTSSCDAYELCVPGMRRIGFFCNYIVFTFFVTTSLKVS